MERGAWASNLSLKFNTIPRWIYEAAVAGTISVEKEWANSTNTQDVTMGLFRQTAITNIVDHGDGTFTYTAGGTAYTVDADGYCYDQSGTLQAYYSGGYLYVLIDTQVLNDNNNWSYVWGLIDSSQTYELLELTTLTHYAITYDEEALQSWSYWTSINTDEVETLLATYSPGETVTGTIVLGDGGMNYTFIDSLGRVGWGYVITEENGSIVTEAVLVSEAPVKNTDDTYTYGAMGDQISYGAIPSSAKWYMIDAGTFDDDSVSPTVTRSTFYLKNADTGNYLCVVDDGSGGYILSVTSNAANATAFFFNSLGELKVANNSIGKRVIFDSSGTTVSVVNGLAQADPQNNVKIYYNSGSASTKGTAYTVTNTELPAIYLKKIADDTDETPLSGASFALYKETNDGTNTTTLYYTWDSTNEKASWVESQNVLTTDDSGWISFYDVEDGTYYLLETAAPDGYNMLTYVIKFVVENGEITEVTDGNGNTLSTVSREANSSGEYLIIQVENKTEEILPSTGGFGAAPYTMAGLILMLGCASVLLYRKRRFVGRSPNG